MRRRTLLAAAVLPSRVFAQTSSRPQLLQGVQAGEVRAGGAIVWSRADRPARPIVEVATTESFADARRFEGAVATEATDFTAHLRLTDLTPGQTVFYRVVAADPDDPRAASAPAVGRFRTPPAAQGDVSFVWSADTVGQGYGINPDLGGMTIYESMRRLDPDFFVHCGDAIYADNPLKPEVKLPDGTMWKNLVTPAKEKVAETLAEFRGAHRYNFLDDNLRRFNAQVPVIAQWDDHDVIDNWYWERRLDDDPRYTEKSVAALARTGHRAFKEYMPVGAALDARQPIYDRFAWGPRLEVFRLDMRSFRNANGPNREPHATPFLGPLQLDWLRHWLKASRATWKVIAADQPLGLVVWDDFRGKTGSEAVANGDDGPPLGRELEIAGLLAFIKREDIRNVVWITADVHYAAAHHYHPDRAAFKDFAPFHEFVAGPLCAGGFGPNPLDMTFGPQVLFQKTPPAGRFNTAPSEGSCNFGHVRIDGKTGAMTVTHRDAAGVAMHATELMPS